ncbi:MAG: 5'-3' exonuclease H3TH domain-containing protein, partial [Polyangia bacterium]
AALARAPHRPVSRPLLVVDTPLLLYRAFFSVPKAVKNNALLGTANTVLSVASAVDARAVVMCLGAESATYRTEAYPRYHAQRPPMPSELAKQWDLVPELFSAFGWLVEDAAPLEADDLLHSYAQREAAAHGHALVLTGDRDLYQSVNARVNVLMVQRGAMAPARIDEAEVVARYGVRPDQVPDFIALRGDPSDGLPGAKGIGEKSARDLLQTYGTLDAVIEQAPHAKTASAAMRALPEQAELLRVFRDVATVRTIDVERPKDHVLDRASAAAAASQHGLERLAKRLETSEP